MLRRIKFALFMFLFVSSYLSISAPSVSAYYTNMEASVVSGQIDFTTIQTGPSQIFTGLIPGNNGMQDVIVDPQGRFIVSDSTNSRVLVWNSIPTVNGKPADLVLGQGDFLSGSANRGGVANAYTLSYPSRVYSNGTMLIVVDAANNRALIWNSFPTQSGQSADVVVGQTDMESTSNTCNSLNLSIPWGVAVYNNKLIIADRGNNRVKVWNSIPTTNGVSADYVLGQSSMTDCSVKPTASNTFSGPRGIFIDAVGKMFLTDIGNRRVLIWNSFPTSNVSADIVVGQEDFTSSSAGVGANKFSTNASGVYVDNNRLLVADTNNNRVLIFNSIPTSNGASADIVIGQPNFTSNLVNSGGSVSIRSLAGPYSVSSFYNKLFVGDQINSRVLIYDNAIREPLISLGSTEAAPEGKLRMRGNVRLGEWGRYFLQGSNLTVSVNGGGFGSVSSLYGNREDAHDNLYEFFHEFEPGSGGYTLLFRAFSSNADEENAFYFSPFELKSIVSGSLPTFTFSVNSKYWTNIQDNLSEYQVEVKKDGETNWTTYLEDIPVSPNETNSAYLTTFDPTTGTITVRSNSKTLSGGKYQAKIVALDKWGHRQETPSLEFTSTGLPSFKPTGNTIYNGWFPLQVNKISGVTTNILSSFNPTAIKTNYTSSTSTPTFSGIAYTDATVTLLVTNKNNTSQQKTYTAKATNSLWTLTPTLYSNSIIDLYVQMGDKYNELPAFQINLLE